MSIGELRQLEREVRDTLSKAHEFAVHAKGLPRGSNPRSGFLGIKSDIVSRDLPHHQSALRELKMSMGTGDGTANKLMSDIQGMLFAIDGLLRTLPTGGNSNGPPSSGSATTNPRPGGSGGPAPRPAGRANDIPPVTKRSAGNDALPPTRREGRGQSKGNFETGWDIAIRGSRPNVPLHSSQAHQARQRIRAAVAPAFATALDKAVDADLLRQFAAKRSGGVQAAKLRTAYAELATRAFAAEFFRLGGGQLTVSEKDIAVGAIIAVAIAQATATYPIVPPAAVAPMAVLVHRALRPRLAELAQMVAVIATSAAPGAASLPQGAPAHEAAW